MVFKLSWYCDTNSMSYLIESSRCKINYFGGDALVGRHKVGEALSVRSGLPLGLRGTAFGRAQTFPRIFIFGAFLRAQTFPEFLFFAPPRPTIRAHVQLFAPPIYPWVNRTKCFNLLFFFYYKIQIGPLTS
jgi:hypothetical protein